MERTIQWTANEMKKWPGKKSSTALFAPQEIAKVRQFHASVPAYKPTPLRSLRHLAAALGVGGIYIKDESYRFGLNAFKVLGGSYAMSRYLAQRLGRNLEDLTFTQLISQEMREQLGELTFATTTDGNHGRGVAWTAKMLRQKAVVYMPKGSSPQRLESIRAEGAEAYITELNYDDAVRMTAEKAKQNGWLVVQDTAWEGYEEIPGWIMQGYGTMAAEALEQLHDLQVSAPTHVFVQAGVGSVAGAVQGCLAAALPENLPKTVIVEASQADCLYRSVLAADGKPYAVGGAMNTIMAGLACGEPNIGAWGLLRDYSDFFFSCPDWVAAKGMRILGNPLIEDERVISGESGAASVGLLATLLQADDLAAAKVAMGLNEQSQVLLFSTEGDTDPQQYRRIVWDGEYPSYE